SNAVKFTQTGAITVNVQHVEAGEPIPGSAGLADVECVVFCVTDTGLGISEEDQEFIFDEFTQVNHDIQRRVRGTGLGLPLCRNLATLLGGRVWVERELGAGSRFFLLVPRFFRPAEAAARTGRAAATVRRAAPPKLPLLIVSESDRRRRRIESFFEG